MAWWYCKACNGPPVEGGQYEKPWIGPCPNCGRFADAVTEGLLSKDRKKVTAASAISYETTYIPTGIDGFDVTVNGGLVPGTVTLIGGYPEAGKSSLAMMVAHGCATRRGGALYASAEEGEEGLLSICKRLGCLSDDLELLGNQYSIEKVIDHAKTAKPFLIVIDSAQKIVSDRSGGGPGSPAQLTAVFNTIAHYVRETKRCAIVINQVTAGGELKGGTIGQHDVDIVLLLAYAYADKDEFCPIQEDTERPIRVLMCDKGRRGQGDATYWRMHKDGRFENVPRRKRKSVLDWRT